MRSGQYSQRKAAGAGTAGAAPMDANTAAALRNAEVLFETRSIAEIRQVKPHDPPPGPMVWHDVLTGITDGGSSGPPPLSRSTKHQDPKP
jgi:hypothetical protein